MLKWDLPKGPPPSWLDAKDERTTDASPRLGRHAFVVACVDALIDRGCTPAQAADVTANSVNETGGGRFYRQYNLGGWKITKAYAEAYRKMHGKGPPWWEAPGNKAPGATPQDLKGGDPPWCRYRVFESLGDFLGAWLAHFVPRPDAPAPYPGYRACGAAFWEGKTWFPLLIRAGYKGRRTAASPGSAVAEHAALATEARVRWAQSRLRDAGFYSGALDGDWGKQSRVACGEYQAKHLLPVTHLPDDATLAHLAAR